MRIKKEKISFKTKASPFPRRLKTKAWSNIETVIELTSYLVPKPGMIKDEKGLVNQPMVKRSCHDLIMTQSFEMRQKIKELNSLCGRRRKG